MRALLSLAALLALLSAPFAREPRADTLERSVCTRDGAVREIELHSVPDIERVCDVIDRRRSEAMEERTLHFATDHDFCRARFRERVRALTDDGWSCTDMKKPSARALAPMPKRRGPFATAYLERCRGALKSRYERFESICDCAVDAMDTTGFTERDYEVLDAPHADGSAELPVHAAGLLYGLGMAAVDALERCGTSATKR